jgi:hypothetical protein
MNRHRYNVGWHTFHPGKLALFALLSVADLFMTWQLVQASDGKVYESNPVANAWLASFGWTGLTIFKGLAILLVAGTAVYVSWHRPRTGGRLLIFACGATAFVVVYSCYLGLTGEPLNAAGTEEALSAQQKGQILDREMVRQKQYQVLLAQLSNNLLARQITLPDAVCQLAQSEKARNPQWLTVLHRTYPGRSDTECLAIHLINHALSTLAKDPASRQRMASQLEAEYQTTYGSEVLLDLALQTDDSNWPAVQPTQVSALIPAVVFANSPKQ